MATMSATATNVGPTLMCAQVRGHSYFADVPEEMGGHDVAALPPEMLCAALANCIGMIVSLACRDEDIPYEGLTVEVQAQPDEQRDQLDGFTVTITMPEDLSAEERAVVEQAQALSKVRGTIINGASVQVTVA
ncbi:MAG: OsmC family protein [Armatimonadota bacterium]